MNKNKGTKGYRKGISKNTLNNIIIPKNIEENYSFSVFENGKLIIKSKQNLKT